MHGPVPVATAVLPAVPAAFTGREEDLARLMPVLDPAADDDLPVVICAVSGLGGIGKTSLALYAAHHAVRGGWFPGGTLFVDFRGYDEDPVTADQAVLALLDKLGVRGADLPATPAEQYDLYRTLLARRRDPMLLILDNASAPAQFAPLLPGAGHHRVLITSRDRYRLTDLDARLIDLDILRPDAAADLIAKSLRISDERDDRAAREPGALAELAAVCGHHPLALQIAAGLLRRHRLRGIASLVEELRGTKDPTETLGVRPVFEAAYDQLPPPQARLLLLLSLAPAAEVSGEAATALAGLAPEETSALLQELASAHLVTPVPTDAGARWRLHDLVRTFGRRLAAGRPDLAEEGEAARQRLLEFYLRWTDAADARLQWFPGMPEPERFTDRADALAWLDGERTGLVAAVQWAKDEPYATMGARLSLLLTEYLQWRRYFDDLTTVGRAAQEAAGRTGKHTDEAFAWHSLGVALRETGRTDESIDAHTRSRDLFEAAADRYGEAIAWGHLGTALTAAGRAAEAVDAHIRCRDLFQEIGDRNGEASAWDNLGTALEGMGRLKAAIDAHTHSLDLFRATRDRYREGVASHNLGTALQKLGRARKAIDAYEKALAVFREFDDWYKVGRTLCNVALVHQSARRRIRARRVARSHYLQAVQAFTLANAPMEAAEAQSAADALT